MPDAVGAGLPVAPDAQRVCKACGLCCRGVWFSHVGLEPDERDLARQAGLPLDEVDGKVSFQQPCVLHRNDACSAYETWRPKACVEYTCELLDRYVTGKVTLEKTLSHVQSARAMADRVQREAGSSAGGLRGEVFLSRLGNLPHAEATGLPPLSPDIKMDAVALRVFFKKYFLKKIE